MINFIKTVCEFLGVLAVLTARVTKASWNGSKKGEWERKILAQKRAEEKEKIKILLAIAITSPRELFLRKH